MVFTTFAFVGRRAWTVLGPVAKLTTAGTLAFGHHFLQGYALRFRSVVEPALAFALTFALREAALGAFAFESFSFARRLEGTAT